MKHLFVILFSIVLTAIPAASILAANNDGDDDSTKRQILPLYSKNPVFWAYSDSLALLVKRQAAMKAFSGKLSPYFFRLFAPGTVYTSALAQQMGYATPLSFQRPLLSIGTTTDYQLQLNQAINNQLSIAYLQYPRLFSTTQEKLMSTPKLITDIEQLTEETIPLETEPLPLELPDIEPEAVMPEVKRPNFWTFKGNGSLQFTQTHFSDNWYQGGEDNYVMLSQLSLEANFDNKRLLQWNNKLEAQLGFQTSENTQPKFRATSNVVRFTSNLGIKAAENWTYAAQIQLESQPYMSYDNKGEKVTADFLSPLFIRSSIGMDYKLKTKRFEGKCHLAPLSYVITYVDRDDLIGRHGIREGHNAKHEWGPNIDINFTYKMWENISWTSRIYWFTNLKQTLIECENTLNFSINRYLSTKLFIYPRFDDSSLKYKAGEEHDGSYWMFKEWLSLGLNYDF